MQVRNYRKDILGPLPFFPHPYPLFYKEMNNKTVLIKHIKTKSKKEKKM